MSPQTHPLWLRRIALASLIGEFLLAVSGVSVASPPALPVNLIGSSDSDADAAGDAWHFLSQLDRTNFLLGDMWGLRTALGKYGVTVAMVETSELLGNLTGGVRTGTAYDGLTQWQVRVDSRKAFNYAGGLLNISALSSHGNNLSSTHLLSLQTASGIETNPSTRLWEFWYSQNFSEENRLNVKVGQQSLDQDFMVNQNGQYFINTMMGWPMLPSSDLPAGGPAYPLSALGIRVAASPINSVNLLVGVFNASPIDNHNPTTDSVNQDHGTNWFLGQGALTIAEAQWIYPSSAQLVTPESHASLSWSFKVGGWYDSQRFQNLDSGIDSSGSLISTIAGQRRGNYALYALFDHIIFQNQVDPNQTLSIFARMEKTPLEDRNLIDWSANGGIVLKSPLPYRAPDSLGFGFGIAHLSQSAQQSDRLQKIVNGGNGLIRSQEDFLELSYSYQMRPWLQIQPDVQLVIHPGGGIVNPDNPLTAIANEWVLGIRANIQF